MNNLLIFGFGFSAEAVAEAARSDFKRICGTTRSEQKAAQQRGSGIEAVIFEGDRSPALEKQMQECTHVLVSISPGEADPVLAAYPDLPALMPNLQWIGYLSTVGVYGDHDGRWVTEESDLRPVSKRSIERVAAEQAWQKLADDAGVPLAIFRLSGIYGPGRNWFVNIEKGRSRRLVKPGQVFNRIHREDIGLAVSAAMRSDMAGIFNITDNEPAPPQDVVTYAHELMGIEPPPEIEFETADLTPMARSFYGENKRVSNAKSREVLGIDYRWPNYRDALKRMWADGSWKRLDS